MNGWKAFTGLAAALVLLTGCGGGSKTDPFPNERKSPIFATMTPSSGPAAGGQVVTITGAQFSGHRTAVVAHFATEDVTATVISDTEMHAVTPAFPPQNGSQPFQVPVSLEADHRLSLDTIGQSAAFPYQYVP